MILVHFCLRQHVTPARLAELKRRRHGKSVCFYVTSIIVLLKCDLGTKVRVGVLNQIASHLVEILAVSDKKESSLVKQFVYGFYTLLLLLYYKD